MNREGPGQVRNPLRISRQKGLYREKRRRLGMNTLQTLTFSVRIRAPRKKVWETMLNDSTYREWADEFSPGSYYTGDWSEGGEMRFLAPGKDGAIAGLISTIMEIRPYEFLAIEHQGSIHDGKEDHSS